VTMVRSTTTRGSSEVDVTFGEDADPVTSFEMLSAAVAHTRSKLPADTQVDAGAAHHRHLPHHRHQHEFENSQSHRNSPTSQNYELVPSLHLIEGTYRVEVVGAKYREFVVRLDPARMMQHEMSPADVVSGMAKNNVIASAGRMNESHRDAAYRRHHRLASGPIRLRRCRSQRLAGNWSGSATSPRSNLGIKEDYIRTASENGAAVLIGISRRPGGNTVQIAADARKIVADFRTRYPDVKLTCSYDQSRPGDRIVQQRPRRNHPGAGARGASGLGVHDESDQRHRRGKSWWPCTVAITSS